MQSENRITIDQVAQLCGVSKTTISRFLNGKFENISPATQQRIRSVIDEVGYKPNRSAQRLKASQSRLIGCVIGDIGNPFTGLLFKGIISACNEAGYQVLIASTSESLEHERKAIEEFLENRVDGLIVNTVGGNDDYLQRVADSGTPVVLADRGQDHDIRLDTVASPNRSMAYECVSYLLACGYKRIAFFTEGNRSVYPRIQRLEGYKDAVAQLSIGSLAPLIYEFDINDVVSCRQAIRSFRESFPGERIAALSVNGATTRQMLFALRGENIVPGRDFGLCSFDNWDWLQLAPPGITCVSLETEQIGEIAAKLVLERINGKTEACVPARYIELPAKIIARDSTVVE